VETLQTNVVADGLVFGEGPRWHEGRLWVADIAAGRVSVLGASGELETMVETPGASGLGWLPDGRMVISTLGRPYVRCVEPSGEVVTLHDLRALGQTLNDMVVTSDGRIYTDLYFTLDAPRHGAIALLTPDGEMRIAADEIVGPNGLAITADGSTLIASETGAGRLLAFSVGDDGSLRDRRVFAELGGERRPDGICIDAEGAVWVGSYNTGEFLRILDGGTITHCIATPGRWAVAPALGGDDGRDLYLVVNDEGGEMLAGASGGRIEMTRVDVPGVGPS
jgi:sugar lactone lactonase YvrE